MATDGSVTIDVRIDTSQFKRATVDMKGALGGLSQKVKQLGSTLKNALSFSGKSKGIENTETTIKDQSEDVLKILNNTETSAKAKAASIAAIYRKQGMSQKEAFQKAWEQIERDSSKGSKSVKDDLNGIGKQAKNTGNDLKTNLSASISSAVKKIGAMVGGLYLGKKLLDFGKDALELGSNLAEVQNVVDTVFPTMTSSVDDFAKSAAASFGLSETMAKQYAGTFGAMAKSFGFTEDASYNMSTALTGLSGDVASFYNISQDEAYTKLKSVFTGETESLKELGVVMTQAALDQYALANGYGKTTSKMTEQEKVALRYQFVMDQLSTASGDFAKTSDGWANQTRLLSLQFDSLKASIGQGLISVFTPVIKVINTLLGKLVVLANGFKTFAESLTGISGATSNGLAGVASEAADAANSTEDLADATTDAKKANKGYLSGLDEIKTFTADDSSSGTVDTAIPSAGGASNGATSADTGALDKISGLLDIIADKFNRMKQLFSSGFWTGLGDYKPILVDLQSDLSSIGESIRDIFTDSAVTTSAQNFANTVVGMYGEIAGSMASIGLTTAANLVGGMEKYLSQNKDRLKSYFVSMFDIGAEIATTIGDFSVSVADIFSVFAGDTAQQITGDLIGIFAEVGMLATELASKLGRDIINFIAQPIIDNKDKIKDALSGTLDAIQPLTDGVLTIVQTIRDTVNDLYDQHLKPLLDSITDGVSTLLGILLDGYNTYILPVLDGLGDKFQQLIDGPFKDMMDKVQTALGKLIDAVKLLWENVLMPLFTWIAESIMPIIAPIIDMIGSTVMNVLGILMDTIGALADVLGGIIDFIVGVFTGDWDKAWTGIKEIFGGVWDLITGIVSGAIDAVATIISDGFNAVKTTISSIWNGIKTFVSFILGDIGDTFLNKLGQICSYVSDIGDKIRGAFVGAIGDMVSKVSYTIHTLKETFGNVFNGIKDVVRNPINAILGFINGLISGVENMVNTIARALNSMSFKIPDWVPVYGGGQFGFNLPTFSFGRVPYLAQGAVIPPNAPFAAVLGDQRSGNNIEAPESLIRKIVREESGSNSSGGNYHFTAQINRRTLFDEMIAEAKLRRTQTGKNPLEV